MTDDSGPVLSDGARVGLTVGHLCWLVDDPERTRADLRAAGLGSERGMFYERAGTQHWNVWLEPPQHLELLAIADRELAARSDVGPQVLAAEQRGAGLFAWAVLVDDLDAVAARLGLAVDDDTLEQPDGTLRGWRTVSSPAHLPFFVDYPRNGDRTARLRAGYERCGHAARPTRFHALHLAFDEEEVRVARPARPAAALLRGHGRAVRRRHRHRPRTGPGADGRRRPSVN